MLNWFSDQEQQKNVKRTSENDLLGNPRMQFKAPASKSTAVEPSKPTP